MSDRLALFLALGGSALISSIIGVLISGVANGVKRKKKGLDELTAAIKNKEKALYGGVRALLRKELGDMYEQGLTKGYATIYEKQTFECMYEQYRELGGNSLIDNIHDSYIALPSIEDMKNKDD